MLKHLSYVFLFALLSFTLKAQRDSISLLENVTIVGHRVFNLSSGIKYSSFDSLQLSDYEGSDLSELLSYQSPIFIKSQGPGNLATTSFRGGSASHMAVVWNGFNINSSMNGLVDLSLVPIALHDEIDLQYGASTSLWGSGALGGAIHLQNAPKFKNHYSGTYSVESFSYQNFEKLNGHSQSLTYKQGADNWFASIKIFQSENDNNYPYSKNISDRSGRKENPRSLIKNSGLTTDVYWKVRPNQLLEIHYWLQDLDRNIPPAITESINNGKLTDETHRLALQYSIQTRLGKWSIRSAYFSKDLLFKTDLIDDSPSISSNIVNEINWDYSIENKNFISIGLNHNISQASNFNYADVIVDSNKILVEQAQNRFALFGAYKRNILNQKSQLSFSLRQEFLDSKAVPFTFSLGMDYRLPADLLLGVNFSKVYRIPNLNDLYWNPGGNPDLKSEDGFALEGNLSKKLKQGNWSTEYHYSIYYRRVNNWIQWTPGIVWTPQNLLEVESYGNEVDFKSQYRLGSWTASLYLNFAYTISENQNATANTESSLGKQLIYSPIYQGNSQFSLTYNNFRMSYEHQYVGYVYITSDHSQFIEPYDPASIRLQYQYPIGLMRTSIWFGVNNIYNEDYQVVIGRPMPLRYYNFGLKIKLN